MRRWQRSLAQGWKAVVESVSGTSRGKTIYPRLWIPLSILVGMRLAEAFFQAYGCRSRLKSGAFPNGLCGCTEL